MALEKLQDWEQALESYDRAIEADQSMTVAYLYRGGVCNRLQRYREALESYEQALRTEKKSQAS
jgi:tetratricopeptide (TPR) repeat protein